MNERNVAFHVRAMRTGFAFRNGRWIFRAIELALMIGFLLVFQPAAWYQWVYFVLYSSLIESIGWVERLADIQEEAA